MTMLPGQARWFLERALFPASVLLLPYGGMAALVLVAWLGLHIPHINPVLHQTGPTQVSHSVSGWRRQNEL